VLVALFNGTDCPAASALPLHSWPAALPSTAPGAGAWLTLTMPTTVAPASSAFLRISPASGNGSRNYSEVFSLQPRHMPVAGPWQACSSTCVAGSSGAVQGTQMRTVACAVNPSLPLTNGTVLLQPSCSSLPWNVTMFNSGERACLFEATGCRTYR
jgi:hypothetical protein